MEFKTLGLTGGKVFFKKILKVFSPPLWALLLLIPISVAALVYVFTNNLNEHIIAYGTYVISFYTLCAAVVWSAAILPNRIRALKQKLYDNPAGEKFMTDMRFRTQISLYTSFAVNILYVTINAVSFVLSGSAWFGVFAVYYAILAVMRFLLLRYERTSNDEKSLLRELKRSRVCAVIMLLVNLCLSGAVLMILFLDKGFAYHGMLIYVMAAYTFWITTLAIINLVKYRKYESPVMTMAKTVNLTAALVSMLSLETAMLSEFGKDMPENSKLIFISLTGAGISVVVITMSVFCIVKNTIRIAKIKKENDYGKQII